jgi:cobalt-zinc-cadmium efflux system outer membrane protein
VGVAAFTVRRLWVVALAAGCAPLGDGIDLRPVPGPAGTAAPFRPPPPAREAPDVRAAFRGPAVPVQPVAAAEAAGPVAPETLDDFVRLAAERNPRVARAAANIEAARGRHLQAGLYPNPELTVNWDEIGDRSSPDRLGILTAPRVTQTVVTGRKLTLAQAVAAREVDQAALGLISERYAVVGSVRAAFYEALALQRRGDILAELLKLSEAVVANGKTLLDKQQIAPLDFIQLEVERERFRAELQAVRRELPGAYRRLAAVAGSNATIPPAVAGTFDGLPDYDPDAARAAVVEFHPQARSARVGVERAQAAVRRAEAEPIPNVAVYGAFIRQYENRSYDGAVGVSMPVPVWNRNQGNIRAAQAELGAAIQAVGQAENELAARVAAAYQTYAAARERASVYQKELIPRAEETYKLSLAAFKGGQFEYLRVIQAQRAAAEARLELNRSLGDAWRAAAELSGLLLEDAWPAAPPAGPMVPPAPPPGVKGP